MTVTKSRFSKSWAMTFPACEDAVAGIRAWTVLRVRGIGHPGKCGAAELIVSELATNAMRAAPGRTIKVMVARHGEHCVVAVWDPVPEPPKPAPDPLADVENGDFDRNGGRGLLIVAATAEDWGWTPSPIRGGKWVWARL